QRSAKLVEHRPTDTCLAALDLNDLGDRRDAELDRRDDIDPSVAALLGDNDVFVAHRFEKVADEVLEPIRIHGDEALAEQGSLARIESLHRVQHLPPRIRRSRREAYGVFRAMRRNRVDVPIARDEASLDEVED